MIVALHPILRTCCKVKLPKNFSPLRFLSIATEGSANISSGINETVIKDKLRAFSVPYTDGYTCFHVQDCSVCLCSKSQVSDNPDIFINKRTGFFLCEQCKLTGNWFTFSGLLRESKTKSTKEVALLKDECVKYDNGGSSSWMEIVSKTSALCDLDNESFEKVFDKFQLTSCSKKAIESLKIRISKERDVLYFPLFCSGSDVVGYKTFDTKMQSSTFPRINCPGFLLHCKNKKTVVVVAHIPDFFALVSQNLPYQVLCLPYGTTTLPQTTLPFLESYNKIILWLGGAGALDSTGNFAKKLNNKRCFVIRPIEGQTSAVTALTRKEAISKILSEAKPTWHEYITTFNSLRDEVLADLQNSEMTVGVPWKRFPDLNKILKGHRRGELTVLTGPTGAGKTTFMSEYSLDLAAQGVNTLWGSFEIKNSRLARTMLQQFNGGPLSDNVAEFDAVADKFEQLPIFFMTFHGQQKISTVMEAVEHCSYTYDIAHVIIDNVQFMIEVSPDSFNIERFWKQDCLIQSFRSFASKNNCHVTLVMHPRKEMEGVALSISSIFGGAKASQEADNIFIIQNKNRSLGGKKTLQISKNRFSGDLGAIPLNFEKTSLSFAKKRPPTEKENQRDSNSTAENS